MTTRDGTERDERGFTLVEMLVAIAITLVIIAPITSAIIIGLRTTGSSSLRLSQARDVELVQGVLPRDVLTATSVEWSHGGNNVTGCAGSHLLLKLMWSTPSLVSGAAGQPGPPTTTLQSSEVDYYYALNPVTPPAPQTGTLTRKLYTGSCSPVGGTSSVLATSLNGTAPTVAVSGTTVKLILTDSSGAQYAACAQMRTSATTTTGAATTTTAPTCSG